MVIEKTADEGLRRRAASKMDGSKAGQTE